MTTRNFSPAEQRAAAESAALARLGAGRERLEEIKARHLVETEALALARMRIQTERSLANQAEALCDAERKAETAAIERRAADLDASREAQRRSALETEACKAAEARKAAAERAEQAARQKLATLAEKQRAIDARREAVRQMRAALNGRRLARLRVAWAALRCASPLKVLAVALVVGGAAGYGGAWWSSRAGFAGNGEEASLRLDMRLSAAPAR